MWLKGFSARIIWIVLQFFNIKAKVTFSTRFPQFYRGNCEERRHEVKVPKISETEAIITGKYYNQITDERSIRIVVK